MATGLTLAVGSYSGISSDYESLSSSSSLFFSSTSLMRNFILLKKYFLSFFPAAAYILFSVREAAYMSSNLQMAARVTNFIITEMSWPRLVR